MVIVFAACDADRSTDGGEASHRATQSGESLIIATVIRVLLLAVLKLKFPPPE